MTKANSTMCKECIHRDIIATQEPCYRCEYNPYLEDNYEPREEGKDDAES